MGRDSVGKRPREYIYILKSDKTENIKIGRTINLPEIRCKDINKQEPYSQYAPWEVIDFRRVPVYKNIESELHYIFRDSLVTDIPGQKELFSVDIEEASQQLDRLASKSGASRPKKIERMFHHEGLSNYLVNLLSVAGCDKRLEKEGVWNLTLFPSTNGGERFFTINIHSHEVAYSWKSQDDQGHMILMDDLILDYEKTLNWVMDRDGEIEPPSHTTELLNSRCISFYGDFTVSQEFLNKPGVREAITAYWDRALKKYDSSIQIKSHNYEAVKQIISRINEQKVAG